MKDLAQVTRGRRELRRSTATLLEALGATSDEVASRLEEFGVRGFVADSRGCAVATYLNAVVGSDPQVRSVAVLAERVLISPMKRWRPPVTVALPESVRRFVAEFDAGKYPRLVRRPGDPSPAPQIPGLADRS